MTRIFRSLIMVFLTTHGGLLSALHCRPLAFPSYPLIGLVHALDPIAVFAVLSGKGAHDRIRLPPGRRRHLPGRKAYRLSNLEFVRSHMRLVRIEPPEAAQVADRAR